METCKLSPGAAVRLLIAPPMIGFALNWSDMNASAIKSQFTCEAAFSNEYIIKSVRKKITQTHFGTLATAFEPDMNDSPFYPKGFLRIEINCFKQCEDDKIH